MFSSNPEGVTRGKYNESQQHDVESDDEENDMVFKRYAMMAIFLIFSTWEISVRYTLDTLHVNICFISCVLKMLPFKGCLVYQNSFLLSYVSYIFLNFFLNF